MEIEATGLGKKFQKNWIFRDLNYQFNASNSYAVTGHNGSGKSTFLQVLIGFVPPNEGQTIFKLNGEILPTEKLVEHFDIVTPYLELVEEFTLEEFLKFHFKFKSLKDQISIDSFIEKIYLEKDRDKEIKFFSSGMKQRLKLGLGFFSNSELLLLDEPTTNLDEKGTEWYLENVKDVIQNKLVLISSNQKHEYEFCNEVIHIPDFKRSNS